MTATDLIRLATELAECGGVHRLTNLIVAASHVHLEHERARIGRLESCLRAILAADERGQGLPFAEAMDEAARLVCWDGKPRARTVEAWEDGPETGVGMSDKAASGAWSPPPHWSQRGAPSRAPERDGECGGPGGPGTDRGALAGSGAPPVAVSPNWGFAIVNNNVLRSNPAPVMPERGERKPLPQSDCQDEHPRGAMQVCPVSDADCLPHCTRTGEADCPLTKRDFGLPRGGISHEPGSPLLKAQDDFGRRRERKVPRYRDPEEWR